MCVVRVLFKYRIMASVQYSFLCRSEMDLSVLLLFSRILLKTHDPTRSKSRTIWAINYIMQLYFIFFFRLIYFHCFH